MTSAPLLICPKCCSLEIDGPELPEDEDVLHCRHCGHSLPYCDMRAQIKASLDEAVRLIQLRIAQRPTKG